jgi:hypothetical protein
VPVDLGDSSADGVRILEDHHCLGGDALRGQLWLLSMEILLKEINLIVLLNGLLGTTSKVLGGLGEAESGVSVKLLLIFGNISRLGVIELLWPTYILNYFIRQSRSGNKTS